jgi:hypothetical protein
MGAAVAASSVKTMCFIGCRSWKAKSDRLTASDHRPADQATGGALAEQRSLIGHEHPADPTALPS